MPPLIWFIHLLILAVVLLFAAFLVAVMAVVAGALVLAAFVLHKLGWDRPLLAYLARRFNVQVVRVDKVRPDDWDEPIDTRGMLIDVEPRDAGRSA